MSAGADPCGPMRSRGGRLVDGRSLDGRSLDGGSLDGGSLGGRSIDAPCLNEPRLSAPRLNAGLFEKTLRETWALALVCGAAAGLVEALLACALPTFREEITSIFLKLGIIRDLLRALLGADIGDAIGPETFAAIAWVHPVPLAIGAAHAIAFSTRLPVGEVDRGTIDVLLGLPVSRLQLYAVETAVAAFWGLALVGCFLAGNSLGARLTPGGAQLSAARLLPVLLNLYLLYLAVAGTGYLASSLSSVRGKAMGAVFAVVVFSYLLSFLAQVWSAAKAVSFLGLLAYYRPLPVIQGQGWPWGDCAVLLGVAGVLWALGAWIFRRRDILTC